MELLQIKVCIFEYSREATILHVCNSTLQVETFQKQILSLQKNLLFIRCIFFAITDIYGYTTDDDTSLRKRLRIHSVMSVNYHYITVLCPFNLLIRFKCYNTV